MTLDTFHLLAPRVQATFALMRGTYLAQRWDKMNKLALYYLPDDARGFFVEVGYDACDGRVVVLQSFSDPGPLENYVQRVQLPNA